MDWIIYTLIGVTLGWSLELLLDFWFWGKRNRHLAAELTQCHTQIRTIQQKMEDVQAQVAHYQTQEEVYRKCQVDLATLTSKHDSLETMTEQITSKLKQSEKRVYQLNEQRAQLKEERDHLETSLEAVDQWVETSIRRRVWNANRRKSAFSRPKDKAAAITRTITATAAAHIDRSAKKFKASASTVKQKFDRIGPKRWLNRGKCAVWALIGKVNKKAIIPQSCSLNTK